MWDNYYDSAEYIEKSNKLDKSGSPVNNPPRQINVRCVSGGENYIVSNEKTSIKYTKEYHIPFMIKEGDTIDGRTVVNVEASKDVFGQFHFCIAKVE